MVEALADDRRVFNSIQSAPVYRSFPSKDKLLPDLAKFLKKVLSNKILPFDPNDPAAKQCNEMGWIHTDATDQQGNDLVCFLPSRLHEK